MPLPGNIDSLTSVQIARILAADNAQSAEGDIERLRLRYPTLDWHRFYAAVAASTALIQNSVTNFSTAGQVIVGSDAAATQRLITVDGLGRVLTVPRRADFVVSNGPGANVQATVTQANVAGTRLVCKGISASLISIAAVAATSTLLLRDGATGVGTVLLQVDFAIPAVADSGDRIALMDLDIIGTAGNAMTLEFQAAGGVNILQKVNLIGYSLVVGQDV